MGVGLFREPTCPTSSIVPEGSVRMPDDNDGVNRSLGMMLSIGPINMLLKNGGVRRIQIIGDGTGPHIQIIVRETEKCRQHATANVI